MALPAILMVDDEPSILNAFRRQLKSEDGFTVVTASTGQRGLALLAEQPFAVLTADMYMPGIDGIQFLKEAKKISPNTVRIMLTGVADLKIAISATNEGDLFRFLTKPCSIETLANTIHDALEQHRLVTAEKELLSKTLRGTIKMLTDILTWVEPVAFGQGVSLREPIRALAGQLALHSTWDIELAAMLLNVGSVVLPPAVAFKFRMQEPLRPGERVLAERVPEVGKRLLSNIPRLETVAEIVHYQNKNFDGTGFPRDEVRGDEIPIGARIVRMLKDLSGFERNGMSRADAVDHMATLTGVYDPALLEVLTTAPQLLYEEPPFEEDRLAVNADQLSLGHLLRANVETIDGVLLIAGGTVITETLLERIRNYSTLVGLREPLYVDPVICDHE